MEPRWKTIQRIVKESDVVLYILDARFIEYSRNLDIEKTIKQIGRPVIFVINKADLVSRTALEKSVDKLRDEGKEVVYTSSKKKNTMRNLLFQIKKVFEKHGKSERERYDKFTPKAERRHRQAFGGIIVGVVGYPNVGKSAIINGLSFSKKAKVSSKAGTTHGLQWVKATDEIKLLDSPGVIPLKYMDESKLALISAKSADKIKEKDIVAMRIIEIFLDTNKKALEKHYKVEIEGSNSMEVLEEIGRKKGHLKKGGEVDETRVSEMIIRDWQTGKLKL